MVSAVTPRNESVRTIGASVVVVVVSAGVSVVVVASSGSSGGSVVAGTAVVVDAIVVVASSGSSGGSVVAGTAVVVDAIVVAAAVVGAGSAPSLPPPPQAPAIKANATNTASVQRYGFPLAMVPPDLVLVCRRPNGTPSVVKP
jgi:hypothetical protein